MLLLDKLQLQYPVIGIYDAPSTEGFEPVIVPVRGRHACLFQYFTAWIKGKTLCLQEDNAGCGGCSYWLFGKESRSREDFVSFLVHDEGLKHDSRMMEAWLEQNHPYKPEFTNLLIGPLNESRMQYLKTVTFFVNADQLSVLNLASYYFDQPGISQPVIAPFGSGCMQALTLFTDLNAPKAIIGSMDIACRQHLPKNIFAYTVTKPMYELFSRIGSTSFLDKPFLETLIKQRGGAL